MASMVNSTAADLNVLDLTNLLKDTDGTCARFVQPLGKRATELGTAGDEIAARIAGLLSDVCSYSLGPVFEREPFGPRFIFGDRRSPAVEDLNEPDLEILGGVVDGLPFPDLRARVADVLFVRRRHHKFGKQAIDAYLEASEHLAQARWSEAVHRIERALVVAFKVRSECDRVVARASHEIVARQGDPTFFSAKLMTALLGLRDGEPAAMASCAEAAARRAQADGDWERARTYLTLEAQWKKKAGNDTDALRARNAAAECFAKWPTNSPLRRSPQHIWRELSNASDLCRIMLSASISSIDSFSPPEPGRWLR